MSNKTTATDRIETAIINDIAKSKQNVLSAERLHKALMKNIPLEMKVDIRPEFITDELIAQTKKDMEGITVEFIPHEDKTLVVSKYETLELLQRDTRKLESIALIDQRLLVVNEETLTVTCLVNDTSLINLKHLLDITA